MISALNYVDVYTTSRLSNIFLIKDKRKNGRKIEVALEQQWERGNGWSQQTDVPCKANSPLCCCAEGVTANMAA